MNSFLNLYSLKPKCTIHLILLSIFVYILGEFLIYNVNEILGWGFRAIGGILFVWLLFVKAKHIPFKGFSLFLYILLVVDIVGITIHTFFFCDPILIGTSINGKLRNILGVYFFLPSIMPLMLFLIPNNRNSIEIKYFVRLMLVLAISYLLFFPFAFTSMIDFELDKTAKEWGEKGGYGDFIMHSTLHIAVLATPALLFFFHRYLPKRKWLLFLFVSISSVFMAAYMARRGRTVTELSYLVAAYLLYFFYDKKLSKLTLFFLGAAFVIGLYYFVIGSQDTLFSLLYERIDYDTRSAVEESFFLDMDKQSWVWGRGWFGCYYDYGLGAPRPYIETGYLALILRGGLIYLVLYVSLLLFSGLRGLFLSRSIFVKSFSLVILLSIVELYPWGWPQFNFKFYAIWLGVYICNTKLYLKMSDRQIMSLFK